LPVDPLVIQKEKALVARPGLNRFIGYLLIFSDVSVVAFLP
jgi:hypothetical protein